MAGLGTSLILTVVSSGLGFLSSFLLNTLLAKLKESREKEAQEAQDFILIKEAMRHVLRNTLKEEHEYYTNRGYCSVQDKDEVEKTYQTYHGLGGNGFGTQLRNDIMELPDHDVFNKG